MEIESGDILLCQVEKIEGTTVFVKIEGCQKKGTIILSEVYAGRIRNLRDYVTIKKTIVCKVLRVMKDHIELSLRRVTPKERKEILSQHKIEKNYAALLKTILKEKAKETIRRIKQTAPLAEFLEKSKKEPKELENLVGKENTKKILEILNSQKKKKFSAKKEIIISTTEPDGISLIKKSFEGKKDFKIKYLGAGTYSVEKEDNSIKEADQKITKLFEKIEQFFKNKKVTIKIK